MPRMPTYDEIRDDFERGVRTAEQHIEHPFRRHAADAAPQTPATVPATMKAATAAAPPQEDTMTAITDVEGFFGNAKNELVKLEQALPAALADAKKLEGNPLAQVAIQAGEHFAAGILPPEALAVLASNAGRLLSDLLGLYNPQGAQASAAPVQPPAAPVPA
jgi:hypothetical protein